MILSNGYVIQERPQKQDAELPSEGLNIWIPVFPKDLMGVIEICKKCDV